MLVAYAAMTNAPPVAGQNRRVAASPFPKLNACETIELVDPTREAATNIAKGDLRPFTVYGLTSPDAPGIICPDNQYHRLQSRGGTLVSDMSVCGRGHSASNADPAAMEAYNRALGASPAFQQSTGCRAATYCESRYVKRPAHLIATKLDPACPNEPGILSSIAGRGSAADLGAALSAYDGKSPRGKDLLTGALVAALESSNQVNAKILVAAGADINGRLRAPKDAAKPWGPSPLAALYSRDPKRADRLDMARWLLAHGASFINPRAHEALKSAVTWSERASVDLLIKGGASPNGALSRAELDSRAAGNIGTVVNDAFETPFYASIAHAAAFGERVPEDTLAIAVRLYRAGGRYRAGLGDVFGRRSDPRALSVLLAAAHREGRLKEVATRIERGMSNLAASGGSSDAQRRTLDFVRAALACPTIRPVAMEDRIKLCSTGEV